MKTKPFRVDLAGYLLNIIIIGIAALESRLGQTATPGEKMHNVRACKGNNAFVFSCR